MIAIDLPWPSKDLHPNARVHWARKARATKRARSDATLCAMASGAKHIAAERLSVLATFSPPDNRRRDEDGMLSACKAYFDAIAVVVGVDDYRWKVSHETIAPVKGGNVRVTITPINEGKASS